MPSRASLRWDSEDQEGDVVVAGVEREYCTESLLDAVGDLPERPAAELPDIDPARLQVALNDLDEAFRTPIILYYFEEFSYRDIAEQMELPIGTVMSRLARAKVYLRTALVGKEEI